MNDSNTLVMAMLETYKGAVFARDIEAFLRLYDEEVRVFDAWDVWAYEGKAAWRKMVEGWFSSLGEERVRVSFEEIKIVGNEGVCAASAVATYTGISAEGKELQALTNRLTWVVRFDGGAGRVMHEHTSAPVGFNDGKGIFKRK